MGWSMEQPGRSVCWARSQNDVAEDGRGQYPKQEADDQAAARTHGVLRVCLRTNTGTDAWSNAEPNSTAATTARRRCGSSRHKLAAAKTDGDRSKILEKIKAEPLRPDVAGAGGEVRLEGRRRFTHRET